ncbi:unnamed protein product [Miscanthus lutarioriparius]|uniref:Uncharacterized protein n=1 Tax=Miscanthus lutarioriparius TaxID=422564 RepID=A0A811MK79_9POAL|nr:unnamed protein product [Miscanthus lutarioriparius]
MATASSSTASPVTEMPVPTSSTSEPLPSAAPARLRRRCRIVREVSSRYLSTPLPPPSPRLSTSSFHSSMLVNPRARFS